MPASDDGSIEDRLERLEAAVERLQNTVTGLVDAGARLGPGRTGRPVTTGPRRLSTAPGADSATRRARPGPISDLLNRNPQFWVSRLGIGLVLVGLAFLFNYAVERGWLTPAVNVAFGMAFGLGLATIGFRVRARQGWFSQVMFGGAAATWYMTGFAAFQLFDVMSHPVAFGFMVLVTLFTFALSVRQDDSVLAVLGAVGGLGTPFFLYTDTGTVPGLMAYTSGVVVGAGAIYLFKGWRSLIWTTAAGAWFVVALGFDPDTHTNRLALEAGLVTIWLVCWLVPVARELLALQDPSRWPAPAAPVREPARGTDAERPTRHVPVLTVATAVITFSASRAIWDAPETRWGLIAAAGAVLYAAATSLLRRPPRTQLLASAHAVAGAVLAAVAIALLFDQHVHIALWAVEAATLHMLAARLRDAPLNVSAHLLFAFVGFWLLQRIVVVDQFPAEPLLNARALADAVVMAGALAAGRCLKPNGRKAYLLFAHVAFLGWMWRELTPLSGGDGIATAAWGVYGLALLLLFKHRDARSAALATMVLAVAKLVFFDLSQVDAIWRILLFLGFGGVFLAISYYFSGIWREEKRDG